VVLVLVVVVVVDGLLAHLGWLAGWLAGWIGRLGARISP
jgi:hypothetical protein